MLYIIKIICVPKKLIFADQLTHRRANDFSQSHKINNPPLSRERKIVVYICLSIYIYLSIYIFTTTYEHKTKIDLVPMVSIDLHSLFSFSGNFSDTFFLLLQQSLRVLVFFLPR